MKNLNGHIILSVLFALYASFFFTTTGFSQQKLIRSTDLLEEWTFTRGIEGPTMDAKGNLYAVNFREQGTVGIVSPQGIASLYVKLPEGSVGNGIRIDIAGNMYIADYTKHNILKINPFTLEIIVFAHEGKMNQPNDIAISPVTEFLYASDPNWKDSTGKLWLIDRLGKVSLLDDNMGTTNGIEVSPDGMRLYVNESIQRIVWVYDICDDGTLLNKRVFTTFEEYGMDGMRCDSQGNLYITRHGKGTVALFSPNGKLLKEVILKGKLCSNIVLSNDEKRAYVTMADRGMFEIIDLTL